MATKKEGRKKKGDEEKGREETHWPEPRAHIIRLPQ